MKAYNYQGLEKLQEDIAFVSNRLANKGLTTELFTVNMKPFKYKRFMKHVEEQKGLFLKVEEGSVEFISGLKLNVVLI